MKLENAPKLTFQHAAELSVLGYTVGPLTGYIYDPNNNPVRPSDYERLDRLGGLINNMFYMARAIDLYEGREDPAPAVRGGQMQFDSLLQHHPKLTYVYRAMRHLHHKGETTSLHHVAQLLLAAGHNDAAIDAIIALALPQLPEAVVFIERTDIPALPGA